MSMSAAALIAMLEPVMTVLSDSALIKMVEHGRETTNAMYLEWWHSRDFLDMVLPLRLRHLLNPSEVDPHGVCGVDDVSEQVAHMAVHDEFPLPADLFIGGVLACVVISVLRLVLDRMVRPSGSRRAHRCLSVCLSVCPFLSPSLHALPCVVVERNEDAFGAFSNVV